jgi:phosphatidate cytidylyltransferase
MALGNLASRVLVAIVAVPLLLLVIYLESPVFVWGLVFAASIIGMSEFFSMTIDNRKDRQVSTALGAAAIATFYWLPGAFADAQQMLAVQNAAFLLAIVPVALYYLFHFGDMATVARRMAFSITGILYVGFLFTFLALIKRDFGDLGGHFLVLVLATAWLSDTGAYVFGKTMGKHKLYPAVSPKKTWEGAAGAIVFAIAGAVVIRSWLLPEVAWIDMAIMAIGGSVLGQLGDLVISFVKRSTGVKDTGGLLPGHGGILDRVDAVLVIAPFIYVYATLAV